MNFSATDAFLHAKAHHALQSYFSYLQPALFLARDGKLEIGSNGEKELLEKYDVRSVDYLLHASLLISEAFHTLELLFKALLAQRAQYLLFSSIDEYPLRREKIEAARIRRDDRLLDLRRNFEQASSRNASSIGKLASQAAKLLLEPQDDDFGKSVTAREALDRLIYCAGHVVDKPLLTRFDALAQARNQIIHFASFENLLPGTANALSCMLSFSTLDRALFPMLATLPAEYQEQLPWHDEVLQHLMLGNAMPQILQWLSVAKLS
jgi:hypothetical protein